MPVSAEEQPGRVKKSSRNNVSHSRTAGSIQKPRSNSKQQRVRNTRRKLKRVAPVGEQPSERTLKNGRVRNLDLHIPENNQIPRKTKEFLANMSRWKLSQGEDTGRNEHTDPKQKGDNVQSRPDDSLNDGGKNAREDGEQLTRRTSKRAEQLSASAGLSAKAKLFDGMKPSENPAQYSARLRKESRQMAIAIEQKDNHQRQKRKAFNKKCRERLARSKRRKRGECSDSDVDNQDEYDNEDYQSISHLPYYWQEIVRNNGKPVSARRRRRLDRKDKDDTDALPFGDQVERPPDLAVLPVSRSKGAAPGVK